MLEELFFEIGAILVLAGALSMIIYKLRQPLIIAYILTGLIAGPSVFALASSPEVFEVMSQIGVAFLLFTVGLGLNWRSVKETGGIALATGIGQVVFTTVIGLMIAQLFGLELIPSAFLAVAFTFSSTIIIVKLLMDKEDLDSLYGRISIGFLLVQDFIAMFILLGLGALESGAEPQAVLVQAVLKGFIIVPLLWAISTYIVPRVVEYAARSQELLFIFAISWCFLIAGLLVWFGYGLELGALIAGVTLSGTIYEREINARIRPLRDFFLVIFFIVLGTHLDLSAISSVIIPAMVFSAFILIGNPLIVMIIMRSLGYHPRTGFLAGTTVAQISEFSFIVIGAGVSIGYLQDQHLALATLVGLTTIAGSSYLIEYNQRIYEILRPMLSWAEPAHPLKSEYNLEKKTPQVLLFGFHRVGEPILEAIHDMQQSHAVVDYDPQVVRELSEVGESVIYGDVSDENFLEELRVDRARFIISTIPNVSVSLSILNYLNNRDFDGSVIVSARTGEEARQCYEEGATYVIVPKSLGGEKLRELFDEQKTQKRKWKRLGEQTAKGLF